MIVWVPVVVAAILLVGFLSFYLALNMSVYREIQLEENEKALRNRIATEFEIRHKEADLKAKIIQNDKSMAEVYHLRRSAGFNLVPGGYGYAYCDGQSVTDYALPTYQQEQTIKPESQHNHINGQSIAWSDDGDGFAYDVTEPDIIDLCSSIDRLWVIGNPGTGKSTFLLWLVDRYLKNNNDVLIIDTHDHVGKWPERCHVFGGMRDYNEIRSAFRVVHEEMDKRYQRYHSGEKCFRPLRMLADEWTKIPKRCPDIIDMFQEIATEGRKVGIHWVFASHSDRVDKTGMKGFKDFFDGTDRIDLEGHADEMTGEIIIPFKANFRGEKYNHPGPFCVSHDNHNASCGSDPAFYEPQNKTHKTQKQTYKNGVYPVLESPFSAKQHEVYNMANAGLSRREIMKRSKMTGKNYKTLCGWLDDWGFTV